MSVSEAVKLVAVSDLGETQVTEVDSPHGTLAVGLVDGVAFAVSNRCRHLFAPMGKGKICDGQLQCPWHAARYDVRTGEMTRGPQGVFKPLSGAVKATTGSRNLKTYPVEIREGAIWLVS
jgi:nitrite reductase/ring-hydroxylating ferredoxin subunit